MSKSKRKNAFKKQARAAKAPVATEKMSSSEVAAAPMVSARPAAGVAAAKRQPGAHAAIIEHKYVYSELKLISLLAGGIILVLIVLAIIL